MLITDPVRIFISYKKDSVPGDRLGRKFVDEVVSAIKTRAAERNEAISLWYDGDLDPGQDWDARIEEELQAAEVFMLVYSKRFFESQGYISRYELPEIIGRLKAHRARYGSSAAPLIAVVRESVDIQSEVPAAFKELKKLQAANEGQAIPLDGEARAEALAAIADTVLSAATAAMGRRNSTRARPAVQAFVSSYGDLASEIQADGQVSPEDQLKRPVMSLLEAISPALSGKAVKVTSEHRLLGGDSAQNVRLDLAVKTVASSNLLGHVELKNPEKSADPSRPSSWSTHDKKQWAKLKDHPNLIYTNGLEWTLWRSGVSLTVKPVRLDVDPKGIVSETAVAQLAGLLADFLSWTPMAPSTSPALAARLASLARILRESVKEAVLILEANPSTQKTGDLHAVYQFWAKNLIPGASPEQFADSFAQTFTYGMLLARLEGAKDFDDLVSVSASLKTHGHSLIAAVLDSMNQANTRAVVDGPASLISGLVTAVDPVKLSRKSDPWIYFYEHFLTAYDPKQRKDAGVYYTPVPVVEAQVRMVEDVLKTRLGRLRGFADDVTVLDPAAGTGTYPLAIIRRVLDTSPTPRSDATALARNLNGFELLVGPYSVAHLRMTRELEAAKAEMPEAGVNIFLTDTLKESGNVQQNHQSMLWAVEATLSDEQIRASRVKSQVTPVQVIIGNPPYDRGSSKKITGEAGPDSLDRVSVRNMVLEPWGPFDMDERSFEPLLSDFIKPLTRERQGGHAKNLYNLYVYFWRWAIWKSSEQHPKDGSVVSYITAASYLRGPGFAGMREMMRDKFDEIWIIDLGGEGRGALADENVFNIQTPVAIAVAVRLPRTRARASHGRVFYRSLTGKRSDKFDALAAISSLDTKDSEWEEIEGSAGEAFVPLKRGEFATWPALSTIFPWSISGVQFKRKWPIAPSPAWLTKRWAVLSANGEDLHADRAKRAALFRESRDRKIDWKPAAVDRIACEELPPAVLISSADLEDSMVKPSRYAYRSFDRQWCLRDPRVGDYLRKDLWDSHNDKKQVYFSTLTTTRLGRGPAMVVASDVPDMDFFRGSFGARNVMPLFRDSDVQFSNVHGPLTAVLSDAYNRVVSPPRVAAYVFGLLGTGAYVDQFQSELVESLPRIPFTADPVLFDQVADLGDYLIFQGTFGQRGGTSNEYGVSTTALRVGSARFISEHDNTQHLYPKAFKYNEITRQLSVGGSLLSDVTPEVMNYQVSGYLVVKHWLDNRICKAQEDPSSPLDNVGPGKWTFDKELLELLHVVESFVEAEAEGTVLLERVLSSALIDLAGLPEPLPEQCKPLRVPSTNEATEPATLMNVGQG